MDKELKRYIRNVLILSAISITVFVIIGIPMALAQGLTDKQLFMFLGFWIFTLISCPIIVILVEYHLIKERKKEVKRNENKKTNTRT